MVPIPTQFVFHTGFDHTVFTQQEKNMNLKKKIEECSTTTNPSKLRKVKLEMKEEIDNSTNSSMDSELFLCDNDTNSENGDDDLIYSNNVSDRRLFYEATEGDLYKYK